MRCRSVREQLKAYIDGEVDIITRRCIKKHLSSCAECKEAEKKILELTREISQLPTIPSPERLRDKVMANLELNASQTKVPRRLVFTGHYLQYAVLGLFLLAICSSLFPILTRNRGRSEIQNEPARLITAAKSDKAQGYARHIAKSARYGSAPAKSKIISKSIVPAARQLVIKTASVDLQVKDSNKAYDQAARIARSVGGYITDSSTDEADSGNSSFALTIRVPCEGFERAIEQLSKLGKVESRNITGEDISSRVVDLESRLRNKKAEEQQYLQIMDKSKRVSDIMTVSNELYKVRGEVEETQGQIKYLKTSAAMSTIDLNLSEKKKNKPVSGSSLGQTWSDAIASFTATGRSIASAGIWLFVYLPFWALPLGGWFYWRRKTIGNAQ